MTKPQVILRHCDSYDSLRIKKILCEGMDILDVKPYGRTLVKPNLVMPHRRYFAGCYTRPEFTDGLLQALKERGNRITDFAVGERSGLTIPSRYAFVEAKYPEVLRRNKVRAEYFDEKPSIPINLQHPAALRSTIYVPEAITNCDFLVNVPKFKAHSWLKVTFALKNYVGLQDDAYRLVDHNFNLIKKIVDLQEIISSGFIAIDGISAGEYSEIAPSMFPLNLIVMGINPVAVDAVCTHIIGLDPKNVEYIRLAAERGYGPIDLAEIEILGDVSLEEAQQRTKGIRLTLERADEFLNDRGNITVYMGSPPETEYCPGGCPGSLIQAAQIAEIAEPTALQDMHPISFIIGAYNGEIHPQPGEKVVALGDCTSWAGKLNGREISFNSVYNPSSSNKPGRRRAKTAIRKSLDIMLSIFRQRARPIIIIRGCPVPILETTNIFSLLGGTVNLSLRPDILPKFVFYVFISRFIKFLRNLSRLREIYRDKHRKI